MAMVPFAGGYDVPNRLLALASAGVLFFFLRLFSPVVIFSSI